VHVFARLCMKLRVTREYLQPGAKTTNRPSIIFFDLSNHYSEFFIFL